MLADGDRENHASLYGHSQINGEKVSLCANDRLHAAHRQYVCGEQGDCGKHPCDDGFVFSAVFGVFGFDCGIALAQSSWRKGGLPAN